MNFVAISADRRGPSIGSELIQFLSKKTAISLYVHLSLEDLWRG